MSFTKEFKAARRVSTPLVCVRTADPASTVAEILAACLNGKEKPPVLTWDVVHGLRGVNDGGAAEANLVLGGGDPAMVSARPSDMLALAEKLGDDAIVFMHAGHRYLSDPVVGQAVWNLRDGYKSRGAMLVILAAPGATLPAELVDDVLVIDEPLPTPEELAEIVRGTFAAAELALDPATEQKAVDALAGLSAFAAEQSLAMCLTKDGLDAPALWNRKRQVIEQTPGLSVWRGGETFSDLGGVENIKTFLRAVLAGAEPPRAIVFVDEIEKAFAGTGTDLSGVKTEMTGTMLTWMQDREADGAIFIGPPGAAKSAVAKATGNTAGVPTISFDLGAMESSLVGASGDRLRTALKVVDAVAQGRALFIATCNSIASLPPELRRRFTLGTFFFDLPSKAERDAIWQIYLNKYNVEPAQELPDDEGWTGAEIKECCRKAYRLRITLRQAAEYIVPVSRSAAEQIKNLRMQASGRYISASSPGVYQYQETAAAPKGRRIVSLDQRGKET